MYDKYIIFPEAIFAFKISHAFVKYGGLIDQTSYYDMSLCLVWKCIPKKSNYIWGIFPKNSVINNDKALTWEHFQDMEVLWRSWINAYFCCLICRLPKQALDLLDLMLNIDPSQRISSEMALLHPFLADVKPDKINISV